MTEYNKLLKECKKHSLKLKEYVPKMYDALLKEGIEPKKAGDKIKKDLVALHWNRDYINGLLPKRAKDQRKSKAGKKGAENSRHKEAKYPDVEIECINCKNKIKIPHIQVVDWYKTAKPLERPKAEEKPVVVVAPIAT